MWMPCSCTYNKIEGPARGYRLGETGSRSLLSVKFFKSKFLHGAWRWQKISALERYREYFEKIRPNLPENVVALDKTVSFHDAILYDVQRIGPEHIAMQWDWYLIHFLKFKTYHPPTDLFETCGYCDE